MTNDTDIDSMDEDQLRELVKSRGLRSAADTYGGATGTGGSGFRMSGGDDTGDWLNQFERDYNDRVPRSQSDYRRYVITRLGRHGYEAMKRTGKKHLWDPLPESDTVNERY